MKNHHKSEKNDCKWSYCWWGLRNSIHSTNRRLHLTEWCCFRWWSRSGLSAQLSRKHFHQQKICCYWWDYLWARSLLHLIHQRIFLNENHQDLLTCCLRSRNWSTQDCQLCSCLLHLHWRTPYLNALDNHWGWHCQPLPSRSHHHSLTDNFQWWPEL